MTLRQRFVAIGQFLFRFRSFLPLTMFIGLTCLFWSNLPRNTGFSAYIWRTAACAVALAGIVIRCLTIGRIPKGTSGRNTKRQKATFLNTTGIYSAVRNPLYLGNAMMWLGTSLLLEYIWLATVFALCLLIYYAFVVFAEEEYLSEQFGEEYTSYSSQTPALIPSLGRWTPPDRPFSWRMVIRREHDSIFSMATGIVFVFHCMDSRAHIGQFMLRREWTIPWLTLACIWVILKILKKRTRLLSVPKENVSQSTV